MSYKSHQFSLSLFFSYTLCFENSDLLENEAKEKNEKMNKIKAVAVKAKKELDVSKKVVRSSSFLAAETDLPLSVLTSKMRRALPFLNGLSRSAPLKRTWSR